MFQCNLLAGDDGFAAVFNERDDAPVCNITAKNILVKDDEPQKKNDIRKKNPNKSSINNGRGCCNNCIGCHNGKPIAPEVRQQQQQQQQKKNNHNRPKIAVTPMCRPPLSSSPSSSSFTITFAHASSSCSSRTLLPIPRLPKFPDFPAPPALPALFQPELSTDSVILAKGAHHNGKSCAGVEPCCGSIENPGRHASVDWKCFKLQAQLHRDPDQCNRHASHDTKRITIEGRMSCDGIHDASMTFKIRD